jgi:plasmid maintenance system antidote protein VapI
MSKSVTRKLRNIHPGEVLREEFLIPLGVTQYRFGIKGARLEIEN